MGSKKPKPASEAVETRVPEDLADALAAAPAAVAAWHSLTPIAQRDFISWINEAKQATTRQRRIERCCENLAAGKRRPCCYAVVPMDLYKALGSNPAAKATWGGLDSAERRDITDWIEQAEDREARKERIGRVCAMLADGEFRGPKSSNG
ncbi:MAG: YdeI/OmpD-associated family protein [Fimbriimonadaceae bacterium]|nr:YdeI/OmpD-associated family protein [Chthonomonadaceae bacterium]MCO5296996.1 YdeI/OmpD-associated family protein [Fimbriimonadaceae bacterium]